MDDFDEDLVEKSIESGVLETTFSCFGERGADGEGDDDVVWVLGGTARC